MPREVCGIRLERIMDRSKSQTNRTRSSSSTGTSDSSTDNPNGRCVFEEILFNHIQKQILEERIRYDAALVRANAMLQQTRKLKEQVRDLAEDFLGLENHFQHVNSLNTRFKRAAKERLEYLENQSYLASLIASLMSQYENWKLGGNTFYSPRDWMRLKAPEDGLKSGRRMSQHKRRLLYKLLCARGMDKPK